MSLFENWNEASKALAKLKSNQRERDKEQKRLKKECDEAFKEAWELIEKDKLSSTKVVAGNG